MNGCLKLNGDVTDLKPVLQFSLDVLHQKAAGGDRLLLHDDMAAQCREISAQGPDVKMMNTANPRDGGNGCAHAFHIQRELQDRFQIGHITIQLETAIHSATDVLPIHYGGEAVHW